MKMQFKSMLMLLGVSFFISAGFKNADQPGTNVIQSKDQPKPVTVEFLYTATPSPGTFTGTFVAHGALEIWGTSEMTVNRFANVAHCSQTMEAPGGTITILSDCQFSTMEGAWRIVSATGDYEGIKGNGKLVMGFPGSGVLVTESYDGKVR